MNLEVRHLDLVQSVVEEGGLTRAGKRLGLSQSALSHQLRALEEQLGVSLFHRSGRRLTLAPAGERILRTAGLVIPEMERTEMELRQNSTQMSGAIRLGSPAPSWKRQIPRVPHHCPRSASKMVRRRSKQRTGLPYRFPPGTSQRIPESDAPTGLNPSLTGKSLPRS